MTTGEPAVLFDLELPHGRCVGVSMGDAGLHADLQALLKDEEIAAAASWADARRRTWTAGRAALRLALTRAGVDAPAVLPDDRGAPVVPDGVTASISHKERVAVALVSRTGGEGARIGVDVELDAPSRVDVARKVLTAEERAVIDALGGGVEERGRAVRLRFSAKEAVYKAIDPFVRRYVGFHEVTLEVHGDGTTAVALHLAQDEGPFTVDVRWLRRDGLLLTTARVARAAPV